MPNSVLYLYYERGFQFHKVLRNEEWDELEMKLAFPEFPLAKEAIAQSRVLGRQNWKNKKCRNNFFKFKNRISICDSCKFEPRKSKCIMFSQYLYTIEDYLSNFI